MPRPFPRDKKQRGLKSSSKVFVKFNWVVLSNWFNQQTLSEYFEEQVDAGSSLGQKKTSKAK